MKASQIIANSHLCQRAARNICPQNSDELFNTVWLKVAEREIKEPSFMPKNPKLYFVKAMRNQMIDWQRKKCTVEVNDVQNITDDEITTTIPGIEYVQEWINEPTDDDDLQFLKNIITLALNCKDNNDAIKLIGCSHRQYYLYKKLAKQRMYDDYRNSNISDISDLDLV